MYVKEVCMYLRTFSTTLATLAVATRSPNQVHCIWVVGTAHTCTHTYIHTSKIRNHARMNTGITLKLYGRMKMFAMPIVVIFTCIIKLIQHTISKIRTHVSMYVCMYVYGRDLRPWLAESTRRNLLGDFSPLHSQPWPLLWQSNIYISVTMYMQL